MNTAQVLVAVVVALVLGFALLGRGLRRTAAGERFTLLVFSCLRDHAWGVLFAAFPTADADGTVLGIRVCCRAGEILTRSCSRPSTLPP